MNDKLTVGWLRRQIADLPDDSPILPDWREPADVLDEWPSITLHDLHVDQLRDADFPERADRRYLSVTLEPVFDDEDDDLGSLDDFDNEDDDDPLADAAERRDFAAGRCGSCQVNGRSHNVCDECGTCLNCGECDHPDAEDQPCE